MWCQGTNKEKGTVLFDTITQGKTSAINNDDLLLQQMFQTIVEIATITIPKLEKKELNPLMRKRALQAMFVSQLDQPEELQGFIMLLFGY